MNKKTTLIALSCVVALLFLFLVAKPYLKKRDVTNTVKNILIHWQNGDLTLAMTYWEKETDSPPIYGLKSFKIHRAKFFKKDNIQQGYVIATLYFTPDNQFPTEKKWIFELKKTRYGWKVAKFDLLDPAFLQ